MRDYLHSEALIRLQPLEQEVLASEVFSVFPLDELAGNGPGL